MPLNAAVSAVEYPAGITAEEAQAAIPKLNILTKTLLKSGMPSGDISSLIYKTLCSDKTLNSMFAGIYGAMAENADALSMVGVNLSPAAVSAALSAYPDVSKKIASCTNLKGAVELSKNFRWNVSTKNGFSQAFADMMSPFNDLLYAVLCAGTVKANNLISIKGGDGYKTAVVPLLDALDCPSVMSSSDFAASAAGNRKNIIKNIMNMLYASIDKLIKDPIIGATSTLPEIAAYLDSGRLSASIKAMLEPLSIKIAGIFTIPGISDLINKAGDLEDGLDLNSMINSLTAEGGSSSDFKIPEIDLKALAACGTTSGDSFTPDTGAALITVLRWAIKAVRLNSDKLVSDKEGDPVKLLLDKSDDELIKTVIKLLTVSASAPPNNFRWTYPGMTPTAITYTPTLNASNYQEVADKIDPLLTEFIKEENPDSSIEEILRKKIYSSAALSMIVKGIFSVLADEKTAGLFGMMGIPVYPRSVADYIYSSYPYAAKPLYNYSSWENVKTDYMSWGFKDGNKEAFIKALDKVMSPFEPLLSCLLAGNKYSVLGAIDIPGADGYNTVIIPLLEAFGCKAENIRTYDEYKQEVSRSDSLKPIFDTIFTLTDEICASPVKTLCNILPNIIYFINGGLMNSCMENIIYPVKFMLNEAGLGSLLEGAFASMPAPDLNKAVSELLKSPDMKLKLPAPDLNKLGTLGSPLSLQSKHTENGAAAMYTYVKADTPAVILTLLRYLIGAMSLEENAPVLDEMMGSMTGPDKPADPSKGETPDMFAMFMANIGTKFEGMSVDEIIEWLYDLLFRETPKVTIHDADAEIPTIIYEEEFHMPHSIIFLLIFIFFASAFITLIVLYKKGKLDNYIERRQKKIDDKRRREEMEKIIRAKISSGELKAPPEEYLKEKKKAQPKIIPNPYASKETQKLMKRQNKAMKKSEKNDIKSQKHYEKAVKEAQKKSESGRDKK